MAGAIKSILTMHSNQTSPFILTRIDDFTNPKITPDYLKLLIEVANYRHPNNTKKRIKLFLRSIFWFKQTAEWYRQITFSPLLSELVKAQRGLIEKPHKQYLRLDYSIGERLNKILDHYSVFTSLFDDFRIQQIVFGAGIVLARIEISPEEIFELTLNVIEDECKEGELLIRLHRPNEPDLAIIRFSLLSHKTGNMLYIAAIQGPKGTDSRNKVKDACKALCGLSPTRLVLESCLALAKYLKVDQVLVVSDKQQVFASKNNKHFSYDIFCKELGGVLTHDGDYQIPLFIERKKREDTPRKRRAKYQRQHALLDTVYTNSIEALNGKQHGAKVSNQPEPIPKDWYAVS